MQKIYKYSESDLRCGESHFVSTKLEMKIKLN